MILYGHSIEILAQNEGTCAIFWLSLIVASKEQLCDFVAPQCMKHHGISSSFGLPKFLRTFVFRTIVLHTNVLAPRESRKIRLQSPRGDFALFSALLGWCFKKSIDICLQLLYAVIVDMETFPQSAKRIFFLILFFLLNVETFP